MTKTTSNAKRIATVIVLAFTSVAGLLATPSAQGQSYVLQAPYTESGAYWYPGGGAASAWADKETGQLTARSAGAAAALTSRGAIARSSTTSVPVPWCYPGPPFCFPDLGLPSVPYPVPPGPAGTTPSAMSFIRTTEPVPDARSAAYAITIEIASASVRPRSLFRDGRGSVDAGVSLLVHDRIGHGWWTELASPAVPTARRGEHTFYVRKERPSWSSGTLTVSLATFADDIARAEADVRIVNIVAAYEI